MLKNIYTALQSQDDRAPDQQSADLLEVFATIAPSVQKERVLTALRNFDRANISTIHSCCQRIIAENAFECDALFGTLLQKDTAEIEASLFRDYLRKNIYNQPAMMAIYAQSATPHDHLASYES